MPQDPADFAAMAHALRDALRRLKVSDKRVTVILGEQLVFKEFSHQPVNVKAVQGFSHIEAKTVLHENAEAYTLASMQYGAYKNEAGEVTSMLLAVPTVLLKKLRAGFSAAGFTVEAVHSMFDCYTAVLSRVLPVVAPKLTGAAIDFGYEYTLIHLYSKGELVSQRRLSGVLACLAPVVMEDTGCTAAEVSEKLAENKFSPAYAEKASAALTNFTYDILRTLRVLTAPLRITPEQFFLSGAACRDKAFLNLVQESLGMPCLVADAEAKQLAPYVAASGSLAGLMVLSGPRYDTVDLLDEIRQKNTGSFFNVTSCAIITLVTLAGLAVPLVVQQMKQHTLHNEKQRYEVLSVVQTHMDTLAQARGQITDLENKEATLAQYNSNTGVTLPRVLALFDSADFALQQAGYNGEEGTYDVSFLADTKEHFLALKDRIYSNEEYYLNLSLSIVRQQEDGSYLCQMHFVPKDYTALPIVEEPAPEATAQPVNPQEIVEGVS